MPSYSQRAELLLATGAPILGYPGVREISSLISSRLSGSSSHSLSSNQIINFYERWMRTAFISTCCVYQRILLGKAAQGLVLSSAQTTYYEASTRKLVADGYLFLQEFLNGLLISKLTEVLSGFSMLAQLTPSQQRVQTSYSRRDVLAQVGRVKELSSRYFYSPVALGIIKPIVLKAMAPVRPVIDEYLGTSFPSIILDGWISLGKSLPCSDQELSANAQSYHYDFDGLKFLKIFIYLSDVLDPSCGPHEYIVGFHCGLPSEIKEYLMSTAPNSRIGMEMTSLFPSISLLSHYGRAGSVIVEDTSGLHRGMPLGADTSREILVVTLINISSKAIKNDLVKET